MKYFDASILLHVVFKDKIMILWVLVREVEFFINRVTLILEDADNNISFVSLAK